MTAVRPGQIWADNDKRSKGHSIRVIAVDDTHATVADVADSRPRPRQTRIRLTRFRPTSTRYRLVRDVEETR